LVTRKKPAPELKFSSLRATASALGFRPHRVLMLPTGARAMNAMMVGPLPAGRFLCLTDGLLQTLDTRSLSGVVAHEIGHARMGHPAILLLLAVMLPLLLLAPLHLVDLDRVDVLLQVGLFAVAVTVVWAGVRALAHRFEHEADVASVRALGAEPCSRALIVVSRLALPVGRHWAGRLSSFHPDERQRLEVMRRYEQDPGFREWFDRRGRVLRGWVLAVAGVALLAAGWSWSAEWRYERVFVSFHSGDVVAAREHYAEVGDVPERWREPWRRLGEMLAVANQLAPDARDWPTARAAFDATGWRRGEQVLLTNGPAAARPWFSLANEANERPSPIELAIEVYCDAVAEGDFERRDRALAIVHRLGVPAGLEAAFTQ
jgi:hypothetical protein